MFFKQHLLSNVCRSPDDPAAPEPEAVAEAPAPDETTPAEQPDAAQLEPQAEPVAQAPASTAPKWALERIGEETSKRQAAEQAAREAIERANTFEEITRRLQAAGKDGQQPAERTSPAPQPTASDDAEIDRRAEHKLFVRDVDAMRQEGLKSYGAQFMEAIQALNAVGAANDDFVAQVLAVDKANAHSLINGLAHDLEKAASLVRMDPARRIAELTRMSMAQAAATPKTEAKPAPEPKPALSRAPAPKPSIAPLAAAPEVDPTTPEGNDKMSDRQFEDWYKSKYIKRTA